MQNTNATMHLNSKITYKQQANQRVCKLWCAKTNDEPRNKP